MNFSPISVCGQGSTSVTTNAHSIENNSNWNVIYEIFCLQRLIKAAEYANFQKEVTGYNEEVAAFEREAEGIHFYSRGHLLAPDFWTRVFRENESVVEQTPAIELFTTLKDNGSSFCLANWVSNDHSLAATIELLGESEMGCLTKQKIENIHQSTKAQFLKENYTDDDAAVKDLDGYYAELFKKLKKEIHCENGVHDGENQPSVVEEEPIPEVVEQNSSPENESQTDPWFKLPKAPNRVKCITNDNKEVIITYPSLIESSIKDKTVLKAITCEPPINFVWKLSYNNSGKGYCVPNGDGINFYQPAPFKIYASTENKYMKQAIRGHGSWNGIPLKPNKDTSTYASVFKSCEDHPPMRVIPKDAYFVTCSKTDGDSVFLFPSNRSKAKPCDLSLISADLFTSNNEHDYKTVVNWIDVAGIDTKEYRNLNSYSFTSDKTLKIAEYSGNITTCKPETQLKILAPDPCDKYDPIGDGFSKNAVKCVNGTKKIILEPGDNLSLCNRNPHDLHGQQSVLLDAKIYEDGRLINGNADIIWEVRDSKSLFSPIHYRDMGILPWIGDSTYVQISDLLTLQVTYRDKDFSCQAIKKVDKIIFAQIDKGYLDGEEDKTFDLSKATFSTIPKGMPVSASWSLLEVQPSIESTWTKEHFFEHSVDGTYSFKYEGHIAKTTFTVEDGIFSCSDVIDDGLSPDKAKELIGLSELDRLRGLINKYSIAIDASISKTKDDGSRDIQIKSYTRGISSFLEEAAQNGWLKELDFENKILLLKWAASSKNLFPHYNTAVQVFNSFKKSEISMLFVELTKEDKDLFVGDEYPPCMLSRLLEKFSGGSEYVSITTQELVKKYLNSFINYSYMNPDLGYRLSQTYRSIQVENQVSSPLQYGVFRAHTDGFQTKIDMKSCGEISVTLDKRTSRGAIAVSYINVYHPINDWVFWIPTEDLKKEMSWFKNPILVPSYLMYVLQQHESIESVKKAIDLTASIAIDALSLYAGVGLLKSGRYVAAFIELSLTVSSMPVNPNYPIRHHLKEELKLSDSEIEYIEQTIFYLNMASISANTLSSMGSRLRKSREMLDAVNLDNVTDSKVNNFLLQLIKKTDDLFPRVKITASAFGNDLAIKQGSTWLSKHPLPDDYYGIMIHRDVTGFYIKQGEDFLRIDAAELANFIQVDLSIPKSKKIVLLSCGAGKMDAAEDARILSQVLTDRTILVADDDVLITEGKGVSLNGDAKWIEIAPGGSSRELPGDLFCPNCPKSVAGNTVSLGDVIGASEKIGITIKKLEDNYPQLFSWVSSVKNKDVTLLKIERLDPALLPQLEIDIANSKYGLGNLFEENPDDIIQIWAKLKTDPAFAWELRYSNSRWEKWSQREFFKQITGVGKLFEEQTVLMALLRKEAAPVYPQLRKTVSDEFKRNLDQYDLFHQVQLRYSDEDFFVADQLFVKFSSDKKSIEDIIVVENKLSDETALTSNQRAARMIGSYTTRSLSVTSQEGTILRQGTALKFERSIQWIKIYDSNDGKVISGMKKLASETE